MVDKSKGFTIIELLLATTIFSFVILMSLFAFVQINGMYYRDCLHRRPKKELEFWPKTLSVR